MRDLWSLFETFPLSNLDDPRKTEVSVRALEAKNDHHYAMTGVGPPPYMRRLAYIAFWILFETSISVG